MFSRCYGVEFDISEAGFFEPALCLLWRAVLPTRRDTKHDKIQEDRPSPTQAIVTQVLSLDNQ